MKNNVEPSSPLSRKNALSFLSDCYRSYRRWQKAKGREKKAKKRLQKMLDFYSGFIKKGDICFDVGANLGNRTEAFLKLGAKVVAVEPQEDCIETLKDKFGNNENVFIVPKALDKAVGEKEIFIGQASTLSTMSQDWIANTKKSGRFKDHNWDSKSTVETTTFDILIKEYGKPAFCKIDVEGFEYNVLQGLSKPVNMISFEFAPESLDSVLNCIKYLSSLGMYKFNYSHGESMAWALQDWKEAGQISEILIKLPKHISVYGDIYAKHC